MSKKEPQFYSEAIVLKLQEHILTLEQSLRLHRVTIGRLRRMNSELRRLKNIQIQNDQEFEAMCEEGV
jgi:hypothetical protein